MRNDVNEESQNVNNVKWKMNKVSNENNIYNVEILFMLNKCNYMNLIQQEDVNELRCEKEIELYIFLFIWCM